MMLNKKWFFGIIFSIIVVLLIGAVIKNISDNEATAVDASDEGSTNEEIHTNVEEDKDREIDNLDDKTDELEDEKENKDGATKAPVREENNGTEKIDEQSRNKSQTITEKGELKENTKNSSTNNTSTSVKVNSSSEKKESISTKTNTVTESIDFKIIRQNDSSLEKGKEVVSQKGKKGTRTITYKETYKNGVLVSKEQVSSEIKKKPVDEIVKVGTKEENINKPSLSEAKKMLVNSGVFNRVSTDGTVYAMDDGGGEIIGVFLDGNGVDKIRYNGRALKSMTGLTEEMLIDVMGSEEEGKQVYKELMQQKEDIKKAVKTAVNAMYGPGTSKANSMYKTIINSDHYGIGFE